MYRGTERFFAKETGYEFYKNPVGVGAQAWRTFISGDRVSITATLTGRRLRGNPLKVFFGRDKSSDILSAHSMHMHGIHGDSVLSCTPVASELTLV